MGIILDIVGYVGLGLIVLGGVLDLIASVGMHRLRNFYLRLHALTVGGIGGSFYPLLGLGMLSLSLTQLGAVRLYLAGLAFSTAFFVLITAPVGSHALARAAYRAGLRPEPIVADRLKEDIEKRGGG
jgi:multicomponent Na+:H+ antiporter subunit G